jgi:segregation and condensation protein A
MIPSSSRPDAAARVLDGEAAPIPETDPAADAPAAEPLPVEGDGYRVSLEKFEGPLDLLLYLIRKEKVDICDIPISRITDQYLESIEAMERLDLDLDRAGDYLLMAATLMRIKARMLVPRDEEEAEEDEIDPREELVRRLIEYREFKQVAETLRIREEEWRDVFFRAGSLRPEVPEPEGFTDLGVSIVDLFRAFRRMVAKLDQQAPLRMVSEEYSVDERMDAIRDLIGEDDGAPFTKLFGDSPTRALLVATFLGLLELIRLREIVADQVDRFGEIWIRPRKEDALAS